MQAIHGNKLSDGINGLVLAVLTIEREPKTWDASIATAGAKHYRELAAWEPQECSSTLTQSSDYRVSQESNQTWKISLIHKENKTSNQQKRSRKILTLYKSEYVIA